MAAARPAAAYSDRLPIGDTRPDRLADSAAARGEGGSPLTDGCVSRPR